MSTEKENININDHFNVYILSLALETTDQELVKNLLLLMKGGSCFFKVRSGCISRVTEAFLSAGYHTATATVRKDVDVILVSKKPL